MYSGYTQDHQAYCDIKNSIREYLSIYIYGTVIQKTVTAIAKAKTKSKSKSVAVP